MLSYKNRNGEPVCPLAVHTQIPANITYSCYNGVSSSVDCFRIEIGLWARFVNSDHDRLIVCSNGKRFVKSSEVSDTYIIVYDNILNIVRSALREVLLHEDNGIMLVGTLHRYGLVNCSASQNV